MNKNIGLSNIFIFLAIIMSVSYAKDFKDVPENHWAYYSIKSMQEKGIISGFEDNTFRPDAVVTREQFATMMVKAFELEEKRFPESFSDVSSSRWSKKYIDIASDFIPYDDDNNLFYPEKGITREEVTAAVTNNTNSNLDEVLNKLKDNNDITYTGAVSHVVKNKIMSGYPDGTFKPKGELTRAEAATIIQSCLTKNLNTYYLSKKNSKFGVIDNFGRVVIENKYDEIHIPDNTRDLFIVRVDENSQIKYKAINKKGEQLFSQYDSIETRWGTEYWIREYIDCLIIENNNGKYGVIDFDGKVIVAPQYDEIYANVYDARSSLYVRLGEDTTNIYYGSTYLYDYSIDDYCINWYRWFSTGDDLDDNEYGFNEYYTCLIEEKYHNMLVDKGEVKPFIDNESEVRGYGDYKYEGLVYLLEEDFDNDGEKEAVGIIGKYYIPDEKAVSYDQLSHYIGSVIYFDNEDYRYLNYDDRTYVSDFKIKDLGKQKLLFITEDYATGSITKVWSFDNGIPELISDNIDLRINSDNTVESLDSSYDSYYYGDGDYWSGHTWKEYFFYIEDGMLKEYGAENIALEQLLLFNGAKEIVDKILMEENEIVEILYRENGIIIINHKSKTTEDGSYSQSYTALKYDENLVYEIKLNEYYMGSDGHYKKAIAPRIATYPKKFIIPKNASNIPEGAEILRITGKTLDFTLSEYYEADVYQVYEDYKLVGYIPDNEYKNVLKIYGYYLPEFSRVSGYCQSTLYEATSTYTDGKIDYSVDNLQNEFLKDNSWVEGTEGYGIGEKVVIYATELSDSDTMMQGELKSGYYFNEEDILKMRNENQTYKASLDGIYIVNGYTATEELWKANSRVKKLKLTIDDKKQYILEVEDTMQPQVFSVNYNTESYEKLYPIKAEFEILEVYEGEKYEDTAINTLIINCSSSIPQGR